MPSDDNITLDIATPAGRYLQDFPKTTQVSEIISAAIAEKGLDASEHFDLVFNGEVLQPQRPLVSYHLTDGAKLELVATGSGV